MKPAKRLAFCGVLTAVSIAIMFMTAVIPIATYAIPAVCGALLLFAVIEFSKKQAMLIYLAVSILSFFIIPDRDASIAYIILFGYYPILKSLLEGKFKRFFVYVFKFMVFVLATAVFLLLSGLISGFEVMKNYPLWVYVIGVLVAIITLFCYDYCLTLLIDAYLNRVREKYFKRFFK